MNKTKEAIYNASIDIFSRCGYTGASMDDIAVSAGVAKGTLYYHFKSKAVMAESILEEGIGGLIEGFERIAAEAPTAPEALTGMVELFATSIFENKAFGRFFVSELWREGRVWSRSMRDYEGRLLDVLEGQLARGQREGFIRSEIDPAFEAVALIGMVLTTTLYYIGDESPLLGAPSHQRAGAQAIGGKDGFIARIVDFVRHANASPGMLG